MQMKQVYIAGLAVLVASAIVVYAAPAGKC